jgi:hypothetical protein
MYWTMSQDGTLEGEVEQRLMLMKGDSSSKAVVPGEAESRALGEANREEIAQILKAAEEKKRKRRGRG